MTDSRIERLLKQMPLSEPPAALDEGVLSVLRQTDSENMSASQSVQVRTSNTQLIRHARSWRLVSGVAIACLVAGVLVGRVSVNPIVAAPKHHPGDGENSDVAGSPEVGAGRNDWNAEDHGNIDDAPTAFAPRVALLCMASSGQSKGESKRCSSCHTGVTASVHGHSQEESLILIQPESPEEVRVLHRQVCARCHQWDRADENWHFPHEIDDAFRHWPPEKQEIDSPTG